MTPWLAAGKIKYREDVIEGLANAPAAFIGMLTGGNFGKLVVRMDATLFKGKTRRERQLLRGRPDQPQRGGSFSR